MPIKQLDQIKNNDSKLTTLYLSKQGLNDKDVADLVKALQSNTHLTVLDLSYNNITKEGAQQLAKITTLERLKLHPGNSIGKEGLQAFENTTLIDFPIKGGSGETIENVRSRVTLNLIKKVKELKLRDTLKENVVADSKPAIRIEPTPETKPEPQKKSNLPGLEIKKTVAVDHTPSKLANITIKTKSGVNLTKVKTLAELKLALRNETTAKLLNQPLSPYMSYLSVTPYKTSLKQSETYIRSEKHPLNSFTREKRYQKAKNGDAAHLGDYINPMQLLGDTCKATNVLLNTTPGDAYLYDRLLKYQVAMCQQVAEQVGTKTQYITVDTYNQFPCVMICLENSIELSYPGKVKTASKEAWANLMISFITGLINFNAFSQGIPIELVRRSSFGFFSPTISPTGASMRINLGIVPKAYAKIVADSLKTLDQTLRYLIEKKANFKIPSDVFFKTPQYLEYIGESSEHHEEIKNCITIMQALWAKAEKSAQGKTTIYSIPRSPEARQQISAEIFSKLAKPNEEKKLTESESKSSDPLGKIFAEVLSSTLKQGKLIPSSKDKTKTTISFKPEKTTLYPCKFNDLTYFAKINDPEFWQLQCELIQRLSPLENENQFPLLQNTLDNLKTCYKKNNLQNLYSYWESIHQCILAIAISNKETTLVGDGYGSDSDTEEEIEKKPVVAKKIIIHNGMRAIWTTLLGIQAVHIVKCIKNEQKDDLRVYATSAYYEVLSGLKLLPKHHVKQATGNIEKVDKKSLANVCILDMNACVTDGKGNFDLFEQLEYAKGKILILDATSASIDLCRKSLEWVVKNTRFNAVFFVSSGLKNEQIASDLNHYGTVRIFAKDKATRESYYTAIKKAETIPLLSPVSHAHRRLMKKIGATMTTASFFQPKKTQTSSSLPEQSDAPGPGKRVINI